MSAPPLSALNEISRYLDEQPERLRELGPALVAARFVGLHEDATADDGVSVVDRLFNRGAGDRLAWCACFVMAVFDACGFRMWSTSPNEARWWANREAAALEAWCFSRGINVGRAMAPRVNDVFFMDRDGGRAHTGIVASVGPGHIVTIDGNVCDEVALRVRSRKDPKIRGYARPLSL